MPTRRQRNAALRQSIPQEELDKLMRYNLEIGDEFKRAETSAGLRAQGLGAYGPTTAREGQLTEAQEQQMSMSVVKMLTEIAKTEKDYAKAIQPDFKKTMASAILDFYIRMAEANASAMGPQKSNQIKIAGEMAKGELDRLKKEEAGIKLTGGDQTWETLRGLQGKLEAAGGLDSASVQSAFGTDMRGFLTTSPEQGAARLYHLSRQTGYPVEQLIDATRRSLSAGGVEDPTFDSTLRAMSEQAIQGTLGARKAEERMNAALRKVESGLVGTGSYGRKGEGTIMGLLGATGALGGGKMDPAAVASMLGYPDTNNDGKPGPIPENPSAAYAREYIEKTFGGGDDPWARRVTDDWARAVQRDPAFVSYAKAAERKPGEFVRNGQVLQHRLPEIYRRMRADYKSGKLQGMGGPEEGAAPSVIQQRVMEPQRRRLFDRWRQRRASEAEALAETTPEAEAPAAPESPGGPVTEEQLAQGRERAGLPITEGQLADARERAGLAPVGETLPPGEYASGTEGWANYKAYQEEGPSGPKTVYRFIHPGTGSHPNAKKMKGKMVTVTKESDPEAFWTIGEKAFGLGGSPTGTGGAQAPTETPAGTPVDEYGFPMQSDIETGEDVAPAAAPAGGLPDMATLTTPPPTASGEPAQDQGYLSGLRGEGGGFIGGPMDQDPVGKALREGAKREQGRHWLNANKAFLGTDSAGFPIPPTNNHPLFQEWLTITDPEGAARRAELLAEWDADEARRAQEAKAREAEGAAQEQADADNLTGDRDEMLADQSAFEQTQDVPTEPAIPASTGAPTSPEEIARIVDEYGTTPFDAEEFHKGDPTYGEADPDDPRADLTGQSTLATQSFQQPGEVDYPRSPTDAEYDAEAEATGSAFTIRDDQEVLRLPQEMLEGPDETIPAIGGAMGSSMDPTQGGMRSQKPAPIASRDFPGSMTDPPPLSSVAETDRYVPPSQAGVEGHTTFEQTNIPSAPHPRGASTSAKVAASPTHGQAAHAPSVGKSAQASKEIAGLLASAEEKKKQKDTGLGAQ